MSSLREVYHFQVDCHPQRNNKILFWEHFHFCCVISVVRAPKELAAQPNYQITINVPVQRSSAQRLPAPCLHAGICSAPAPENLLLPWGVQMHLSLELESKIVPGELSAETSVTMH